MRILNFQGQLDHFQARLQAEAALAIKTFKSAMINLDWHRISCCSVQCPLMRAQCAVWPSVLLLVQKIDTTPLGPFSPALALVGQTMR